MKKDIVDLDFKEAWTRIQQATGLKNITQLAKVLPVKQPSMSRAKKDGRFPSKWALSIAKTYALNSDWLLYGRGPMHYGNHETIKWVEGFEKLRQALSQATHASTIDEYEKLLEVAEKLREELQTDDPLSLEKKVEIADARILELEEEIKSLKTENQKIKNQLYLDSDPEITLMLSMAKKVLTSGNSIACDALDRNIKYFSHAVEAEIELQQLKDDVKIIKVELTRLKREKLHPDMETEEQSSEQKVA
jgi:hypothetical protein